MLIDFVIASFSATICPEPGVPSFGSYIGRLELGKTVTYSCYKAGLTLIGNKVRTCLHEVGKGNYWTGTLPSCKGNFLYVLTSLLVFCKLIMNLNDAREGGRTSIARTLWL